MSSNLNKRDKINVHLQSQISVYLDRQQLYKSLVEFSYIGKKEYKTYCKRDVPGVLISL